MAQAQDSTYFTFPPSRLSAEEEGFGSFDDGTSLDSEGDETLSPAALRSAKAKVLASSKVGNFLNFAPGKPFTYIRTPYIPVFATIN